MTIRFEDALDKPLLFLRDLCDHVGVDSQEAMLNVVQVGSSAGSEQGNEHGLNRRSIGRWQQGGLNRFEVAVIEKARAEEMRQFGYDLSNNKANPWGAWVYALALPLKLCLALLLNLGRSKSILRYLKRRLR